MAGPSTSWIFFGCGHNPLQLEDYRLWRNDQIERHRPRDGSPYVVVNGGDWMDADAASRWPNENEWTLKDEYRITARDALSIREAAGPDARLVFLSGNHDSNLEAPNRIPLKLREACSWKQDLDMHEALKGWKLIPYGARERFRLGPVTFLHGADLSTNCDRNNSLLYGTEYGLTVGVHTHRPVELTRVVLPGKIPLNRWFANAGTGADWDRMAYVGRSNIAMWGRAVIAGICNARQHRAAFMSPQWEASLIIHSRAQ